MKKKYQATTLNEFILQQQTAFPYAKGDLSRLLNHIGVAAKIVNRKVNKAGLVDILGETGSINVQGESVKKLDLFANEQFKQILGSSIELCGIASEEDPDFIPFDSDYSREGKYIVCIDPLDGSSNIDVNVSIGTIFSVYRRLSPVGTEPVEKDFLQKGSEQVAAGYILYGSSTMMVYTTGLGVTGFTLDPSIGEFCLSHQKIDTPKTGNIYSINEANYLKFPDGVKKFIKYAQEMKPEDNRPWTSRYIGSLAADFHRNLFKGGIFIYPTSAAYPEGKLRLVYECNALAFLVEQAGGQASDGQGNRIMYLRPQSIHQRVPFFAGSEEMVKLAENFCREDD